MPLIKSLRTALGATTIVSGMIAASIAQAGWSTAAQDISRSVNSTHSLTCPGGGSGGTVWGSGIYTADSSVCMAAVHAGFISRSAGGQVQFRILEGQQSYAGSTNNGVTTRDYPAWGLSFQIIGASSGATANALAWNQSLQSMNLHRNTGTTYAFQCAPGAPGATVWGTDVYTADSSICAAAMHRGLISTGGGTVRLRVIEGQGAYYGSSRYGVSTRDYSGWGSSFIFQ